MAEWENAPVAQDEHQPEWASAPVVEQPQSEQTFAAGSPREIARQQSIPAAIALHDFLFSPQAAQNVRGAIQDVVGSIPRMAVDTAKLGYKAIKFPVESPQEQTNTLLKTAAGAMAQGQQLSRDVQSPFGSRENVRGLLNLGMIAAPVVGGTLAERLAGGVLPRPSETTPIAESVVRSELEKPPVQPGQEVIPPKPEAFTSLLQSAEDIRRAELSKPISPEEMGQTIGKTWRSTQGEPNAVEPSNAQVETGQTTQRIEARPAGEVPTAGRSDNVVGEAQGATARGQVPGAETRQGTEAQPQAQITSPEASAAVEPQKPAAIPAEAPAPAVEIPPVQTGVSSERFGEQYGDLAPVANTGKSAAELKATGVSRLDNFQKTGAAKDDPYAVVTNLREGKVPVTQIADDLSLLRAEHQRLRSAAAAAEGAPEYARKIQDAVDMANTIKEVGHGPGSDIMRSFQEYDQPKYDNLTDFELAMRERTGNELTANERSQFERIAKDRARTRDIAANEVDVAQKQIQRFRGREKMSFEDAAKKIQDQITELTKDCI